MATTNDDLEHQILDLQRKLEVQKKENMLQKSILRQKGKEVGVIYHLLLDSRMSLFIDSIKGQCALKFEFGISIA
jgi:hypothetical protein